MNYYDVLELPKKELSSAEEIKKQYFILARKFHPDHNKGEQSQKEFLNIAQAYHVLSNENTRKLYDQSNDSYVTMDSDDSYALVDLSKCPYDPTSQQYKVHCRCGYKLNVSLENIQDEIEIYPCDVCSISTRIVLNS